MQVFRTWLKPEQMFGGMWSGRPTRVWAARERDGMPWQLFQSDGRKHPDPAAFMPPNFQSMMAQAAVRFPLSANGLPGSIGTAECEAWEECRPSPGKFHPRIWKDEPSPSSKDQRREWSAAVTSVSTLVRRTVDMLRFIEPTAANMSTYGHEPRQLLILAAMEVEASWRGILLANGYRDGRLSTNDYVKLHAPMHLDQWRIGLSFHHDSAEFAPFENWDSNQPTQSLSWYDAYNAVKHDREREFARATVQHALTAVAAAYTLVIAQFGEFDSRASLGLDEFSVLESPVFTATEAYVPPLEGITGPDWVPEVLTL